MGVRGRRESGTKSSRYMYSSGTVDQVEFNVTGKRNDPTWIRKMAAYIGTDIEMILAASLEDVNRGPEAQI
jgi:nitrogenase molybdenum-iron protein alpha/beta subunit